MLEKFIVEILGENISSMLMGIITLTFIFFIMNKFFK